MPRLEPTISSIAAAEDIMAPPGAGSRQACAASGGMEARQGIPAATTRQRSRPRRNARDLRAVPDDDSSRRYRRATSKRRSNMERNDDDFCAVLVQAARWDFRVTRKLVEVGYDLRASRSAMPAATACWRRTLSRLRRKRAFPARRSWSWRCPTT